MNETSFTLYPAIDILGGRAVRLVKGDFDRRSDYGPPEAALEAFIESGAEWLHVVDLDGAREGRPVNAARIIDLARRARERGVRVQVGGGVRTVDDALSYVEQGVARVILGTAVVERPDVLERAVQRAGAAIAVGIDARGGRVATRGWQKTQALQAVELARAVARAGVRTIIYTDIGRDGTLSGANVDETRAVARESGLAVIASGGVRALEELIALARHRDEGIAGAVVGRALYTGEVDLRAALQALRAMASTTKNAERRP